MRRPVALRVLALGLIGWTGSLLADQAPRSAPPAPAGSALDAALVQKYCVTCHNTRAKAGGLSLDGMSPSDAGAHAELWEKVVRKLRGGMMPPQGMPRPDEATLDGFSSALELALEAQAQRQPDPGFKGVHRLNRTEYGNAVRDLLSLEVVQWRMSSVLHDAERCTGCSDCAVTCPFRVITMRKSASVEAGR